MMFHIPEVLLAFTISFLVLNVHSQIIFENAAYSCDRMSRCVVPEQCRALYYNQNSNFRPCGENRRDQRVCCPITTSYGVSQETRTLTGRILPVSVKPSTSECGMSKVDSSLPATKIINPLILGGHNATEGLFPWMVALTMWDRNMRAYTPYCSGFLIDHIHVLSAAHCFGDKRLGLYQARIGKVNQTEGEIYPIAGIITHEEFRPDPRSESYYDDIAILTLGRSVSNPDIIPICMPNEEVIQEVDTTGLTVAGWGRTKLNGNLSILLQYLPHLKVVPNQVCNTIIRNNTDRSIFQSQFSQGINNLFICAGISVGGKDACGGDSGGPLMISYKFKWYAVGIVSFGISCGRRGIPGGYTRISEYLDWIEENIRD